MQELLRRRPTAGHGCRWSPGVEVVGRRRLYTEEGRRETTQNSIPLVDTVQKQQASKTKRKQPTATEALLSIYQ